VQHCNFVGPTNSMQDRKVWLLTTVTISENYLSEA
jgi:hypothetical protein